MSLWACRCRGATCDGQGELRRAGGRQGQYGQRLELNFRRGNHSRRCSLGQVEPRNEQMPCRAVPGNGAVSLRAVGNRPEQIGGHHRIRSLRLILERDRLRLADAPFSSECADAKDLAAASGGSWQRTRLSAPRRGLIPSDDIRNSLRVGAPKLNKLFRLVRRLLSRFCHATSRNN